jgi:hypothetical protein
MIVHDTTENIKRIDTTTFATGPEAYSRLKTPPV